MSVSKSNWHIISNILRPKFSCHISFNVSGVTKESCSSKGVTNKSALQTQWKHNHLIKTRVKQKKVNISPHFNVLSVRHSLMHIVFSICSLLTAFYYQCPIRTLLILKYFSLCVIHCVLNQKHCMHNLELVLLITCTLTLHVYSCSEEHQTELLQAISCSSHLTHKFNYETTHHWPLKMIHNFSETRLFLFKGEDRYHL